MNMLEEFRRVITIESKALTELADNADDSVADAIECLYGCRGRIVVIGMGKCGHISRKIAATFASTGTPATFVHPAEALHGDLGFIGKDDVALVLSNSGETIEVCELIPHLKKLDIPIVALTGRPKSTLGRYSKYVLNTGIESEADPIEVAPTTSTTVMLAVGDALACVLMKKRGFSKEDYAVFHPGGNLGQKLLCTVEALMHKGKDVPVASEDISLREALCEVTSKRLGAVLAVDEQGVLAGILTDGDIRRIFQRDSQPLDLSLHSVMTRNPKTIQNDVLAVDALQQMEDSLITQLAVVDSENKPVGILHIHDLIRAGIK